MSLGEQMIRTFGDEILQLPDLLKEGWDFPLAQVPTRLTELVQPELRKDLVDIGQLALSFATLPSRFFENERTLIARRMFGHDLNLLQSNIGGALIFDSDECSLSLVNNFFLEYSAFRSIGLALAYISTADERYVVPISPRYFRSVVEKSLPGFAETKMGTSKVSLSGTALTDNLMLTSLCQIIKNAVAKSKSISGITVREEEDYLVLSVKDAGTGIIYREKGEEKPLPAARFPELFGSFTTKKNGGLGLQIVKHVLDLRKGYAIVRTKTTEGPAIEYDTRENNAVELEENLERGTTFTLYFPQRSC